MRYYIYMLIYMASYILPLYGSIRYYKTLDKSSKIIAQLVITSFVSEVIAFFAVVLYKNNLPVYNIILLVSMLLLGFYFNESSAQLRKSHFVRYYSAVTIGVWLYSILSVHSLFLVNSTFMTFEGIAVICLCIYSMESVLSLKSKVYFKLSESAQFWFSIILMFYWCFSIVQWILYKWFSKEMSSLRFLEVSLVLISILVNVSYGLVFYNYPKMKKIDAA